MLFSPLASVGGSGALAAVDRGPCDVRFRELSHVTTRGSLSILCSVLCTALSTLISLWVLSNFYPSAVITIGASLPSRLQSSFAYTTISRETAV
jgi:hypothetical protein